MIGRVAMDMIAIDVTGLEVQLGTEVELWGKTRLVDDVAEANGTIGYELLCRLSNRPLRKMVGSSLQSKKAQHRLGFFFRLTFVLRPVLCIIALIRHRHDFAERQKD